MASASVGRAAVLSAAAATIALVVGAIGAAFLLGSDTAVEPVESAPGPSSIPGPATAAAGVAAPESIAGTAPDDGPSTEPSSPAVEGSATRDGAAPTPEPAASPDPGPAVVASDPHPQLALEIVEATDPGFEPAGGGERQLTPVEQAGPDDPSGAAGSSGAPPTTGGAYTWHDGDRTLQVRLLLDLVVLGDGGAASSDGIVANTGAGQIVARGTAGAGGADRGDPVFLSDSGSLMTLPGGVLLGLDPEWGTGDTDAFFAGNGIALDRVSELDYLTNGFFVQTEPGFASLELANALARQVGVEFSSPNWSRERTSR